MLFVDCPMQVMPAPVAHGRQCAGKAVLRRALTHHILSLPATCTQTWVKPRKSNGVPLVAAWRIPFGRLKRKSMKRVFSGCSVRPYRARRLPRTARTRLAPRKSSNAITRSSAYRTRVHLPLSRGRTSASNHSSSTWCRINVREQWRDHAPLRRSFSRLA